MRGDAGKKLELFGFFYFGQGGQQLIAQQGGRRWEGGSVCGELRVKRQSGKNRKLGNTLSYSVSPPTPPSPTHVSRSITLKATRGPFRWSTLDTPPPSPTPTNVVS